MAQHSKQKFRALKLQLRRLIGKQALAEEHERRRIALFLSDDLAQILASLHMSLGALEQSALPAEQARALAEALKSIEEMIETVRTFAFDLSPPILYEIGLEPAVQWLAEKTQAEHGIGTSFEADGQDKPLNEDVRLGLFRVVRELLANAARHSRAQSIKVSIHKDGSNIRIEVEDDGVGFDVTEVRARREGKIGFGLLLVKELLRHLGGSLQIDSKPSRGTRVAVLGPLKR